MQAGVAFQRVTRQPAECIPGKETGDSGLLDHGTVRAFAAVTYVTRRWALEGRDHRLFPRVPPAPWPALSPPGFALRPDLRVDYEGLSGGFEGGEKEINILEMLHHIEHILQEAAPSPDGCCDALLSSLFVSKAFPITPPPPFIQGHCS